MTQIMPGMSLGPYRIETLLGEGGMGQVFRAVDSRLGRPVAIKTSLQQFSERFNREAQAIASLNHPHICTLYDVGSNYLVMELIEGETLAGRLRRGKFSAEQTVEYGSQVADALAAAHARGIIHRDLKPQNIMITKSGAKVLDFGLAKSTQDDTLTASGAVMGTPAYMAPEQGEGKDCVPQTDIYSLGLILYEMLTGSRAPRDGPIDFDRLPERLGHTIDRCLAKDPEKRWNAASDVKLELEWAGQKPVRGSASQSTRSRSFWVALIGVFLIVVAALLFATFNIRGPRPAERTASRLAITAPEGTDFAGGSAISPDGRAVVFVAHTSGTDKLWLRQLDSLTARELPGTEAAAYPFWSPDNRSVGFFSVGKLKRIDVNSNAVTVICDVGLGRGGTWNQAGIILFNSVNDGPILRVPANGGDPAAVTTLDAARSENSHRFPYFFPDGRRFLYYVRAADSNVAGLYVANLDRPQEKVRLLASSTAAIYVPATSERSGHLAWVDNGNLMVQPYDPETARLLGEAVPLAQSVKFDGGAARYGEISVSNQGTLVYATASAPEHRLTWFGRDGRNLESIGQPDSYESVRISPDGKTAATSRGRTSSHSGGVAVLELDRGIATHLGLGFWGAWSPDGKRIAYASSPSGAPNVYAAPINRQTDPERLTDSPNSEIPIDWSADDRFILYAEQPNDIKLATESGLWVLPLKDRKPFLFAKTAYRRAHAQFSPDTQWVAYTSTESGRAEIYVQSFPSGHIKSQVSSNGGDYPRWRSDGRELFYLGPDQTLMFLPAQPKAERLEFGAPNRMFRVTLPASSIASLNAYPYDVAANGQRILGFTSDSNNEAQTLVVLSNW